MLAAACPSWFQWYNLFFGIIFVVVTGIISFTGYRAYKFFGTERHKLHSIGFGLLSISFLFSLFVSCMTFFGNSMSLSYGYLLHALFFLAGIITLLFVYIDIRQPAVRFLLYVLGLSLVAFFNIPTSKQQDFVFYLLVALLLGFISFALIKSYFSTRKRSTLFVFAGFSLLLLGHIFYAIAFIDHILFVFGSVVMLIGFLSLAISKFMVKS